jgi:hypothetical protein
MFRYTGNPTSMGSFLTKTLFSSPQEAIKGLALGSYSNSAVYLQTVTSTGSSLVFEGGVAGGTTGVGQTLLVNPNAFEFGTGVSYP